MGREIRRVPPNWEHPQKEAFDYRKQCYVERFQPMYDRDAETAFSEWLADWQKWIDGGHEKERVKYPSVSGLGQYEAFCELYGTAPKPEYHRPAWTDEEATWWQAYETVSEGTPVSPPFATADELVDYLATHGDFWDQKRGDGPWQRKNAEAFVKQGGYVPSMAVIDGKLIEGRDLA